MLRAAAGVEVVIDLARQRKTLHRVDAISDRGEPDARRLFFQPCLDHGESDAEPVFTLVSCGL